MCIFSIKIFNSKQTFFTLDVPKLHCDSFKYVTIIADNYFRPTFLKRNILYKIFIRHVLLFNKILMH